MYSKEDSVKCAPCEPRDIKSGVLENCEELKLWEALALAGKEAIESITNIQTNITNLTISDIHKASRSLRTFERITNTIEDILYYANGRCDDLILNQPKRQAFHKLINE